MLVSLSKLPYLLLNKELWLILSFKVKNTENLLLSFKLNLILLKRSNLA